MVLRMAEQSGLGPVRAACAAAGGFCLGKHQLPFPGRAERPSVGTEAWGRPAPQSELGHPGRGRPRGPARLLPLRPGFSSHAPASRDFIVVPPPNPAVQGRGGPEAGKMPGASRAGWGLDRHLFQGTEAAGDTSVEGAALPWAVGAQPAVHPEPCPGGAHGPQLAASGQRHRGLPLAQGPLAAGGGAATPFSPLPQPRLPGWGSLLGLALRASPLPSDLLTCPLPAQPSMMPPGPQPPCPGPSLQPPTPLVLRP